jgi:hypothetical protein
MESAASGGFAASILRTTALYFLGMRRLDSESPQQAPGSKGGARPALAGAHHTRGGPSRASALGVGGHVTHWGAGLGECVVRGVADRQRGEGCHYPGAAVGGGDRKRGPWEREEAGQG